MKVLLKIIQHGFYSGIDSEKYVCMYDCDINLYLDHFLIENYGKGEYCDILLKFQKDEYLKQHINIGLGELEIINLGEIEVI